VYFSIDPSKYCIILCTDPLPKVFSHTSIALGTYSLTTPAKISDADADFQFINIAILFHKDLVLPADL